MRGLKHERRQDGTYSGRGIRRPCRAHIVVPGKAVLFVTLMLTGALPSLSAGELKVASKVTRTHLLELYTSEGCSSCPPAEAWLSKLKDDPRLWSEFVPLAFHVDYWDRLGWRDPFASKQWTARQHEYSARWKSSSVYTPAFVLNGREWRKREIPTASAERPGVLLMTVNESGAITAKFDPERRDNTAAPLALHVARLGSDLNINVKAGENRGRKLQHDFVVLSLETTKMTAGVKTEMRLPPLHSHAAGARTAIVAWVTEAGALEPIQAVGGWDQRASTAAALR